MISWRISFPILLLLLTILALACVPTPSPTNVSMRISSTQTQAIGSPTPTLEETATFVAIQATAPRVPLRVTYTKGGSIWFWDAAASPKQLTNSGQDSAPRISDDGLVIAFVRNGELWAVDTDGGNERVLASSSALSALDDGVSLSVTPRQFNFAPHSHDIYLNIAIMGDPPKPQYDLARVNVDSLSLQALLNADQGGGQFVFSPDGMKVALPRNDKINVVNADGTGLKTVFTFPRVTYRHGDGTATYIPDIAWLPDGSGFKTVIPPQDQLANPPALTRFMFIPADGGPAAKLAEFVASPAFANRPVISPDGAKVLYTKAQGANLELHIIDASTADQMYFSRAANKFGILGWAPDSTHIVYWMDDSRRTWLGPQDNLAVPLSDVTFAEHVTWIDPERYLFINKTELRLRILGQPSILIDSNLNLSENAFDFTLAH
jgi:Tol biopolymer transport system component